jgi:hypothetical protein
MASRKSRFSSPLPVAALAIGGVLLAFYVFRGKPAPTGGAPSAGHESSAARDMQAEIERVISQEVAGLKTEAEVTAYLAQLEVRARQRGDVTALEVEPGFAAIGRLPPEASERMRREFGKKMSELGRELRQNSVQGTDVR